MKTQYSHCSTVKQKLQHNIQLLLEVNHCHHDLSFTVITVSYQRANLKVSPVEKVQERQG